MTYEAVKVIKILVTCLMVDMKRNFEDTKFLGFTDFVKFQG